jgi:glycosyltransferase involved in cell wall biosynthesis
MEQTLGNVTHYLNLRAAGAAGPLEPRWVPIAYRDGVLPWALRGSLEARRRLAALTDLDGAFVHTTTLSLLTGGLARHLPTVLSTDGTPANKSGMRALYGLGPQSRASERLKRALYRSAFANAAGFVGWTRWAAASFVEDYACPPDRVIAIPPGVDLDLFRPAARPSRIPRILFVGGDFRRKGGDLLVDAFRGRLRGRAELDLVTSAAAPVAEEAGVRLHVGVKPNSERLLALYAGADVLALPTSADCLPLVALEAAACGLPIVCTRVGGLPEAVVDGETGWVIPPGDRGSLADALERLVSDGELRARMGRSARALAERAFDARKNAVRLFEFVAARIAR